MNSEILNECNGPIRMYIALQMLRAWNSGTAGFSGDVVVTVNRWIDGGMNGPVPWPDNPFFAEWAQERGFSKIDDKYVGFRFTAQLIDRPKVGRDTSTEEVQQQ